MAELTVFVEKTPSYNDSRELQLCEQMVREYFSGARWHIYEANNELTKKQFIEKNLQDKGDVIFLREPALLIGQGTLSALRRALTHHSHVDFVLPSDMRGADPDYPASYLTLYGFENHVKQLSSVGPRSVSYDGRQPWLFLTRMEALSGLELPEDPFDIPLVVNSDQVLIVNDAYIHPFFDYYHETRADVLPFLPDHITSLLDVGCARGRFAATVKEKFGCSIKGVEMNQHEAAAAADVLDHLWVGDFMELDIHETFDCITSLDVLEHLENPHAFLKEMRKNLTPGGSLLLSVPNVGHWSIVQDLLAGRWDYAPAGILCVTHLRFYTEHSLRKLLRDCGFECVRLERIKLDPPENVACFLAALGEIGTDIDMKSLATYQFVAVAEQIEDFHE